MSAGSGWQPHLVASGVGEPVMLLHPLGMDRRFWEPIAAGLPSVQALTCEFPGHGTSPTLARCPDVGELATALAGALEAAGYDRVDVVGVSLGGLVAQSLAALDPPRVRRLVLVDTVATYPATARAQWPLRAAAAREHGLGALAEPTLANWFTPAFRRDRPDVTERVRAMLTATNAEGYAQACELLAASDLTGLAALITAPTLVVCGRQDAEAFVDAADWFAATVPDVRLIWLEDARHGAVLERSEAFLAHLTAFLG